VQQGKEFLYVGTNEQAAKLAPVKGFDPPVILTDAYPGFFCKQSCLNGERWGIISIRYDQLNEEMFAPSPAFIERHIKNRRGKTEDRINAILGKIQIYKTKWQNSLKGCGVCLYLAHIPPSAIQKVMIYSPNGRDANPAINKLVGELPEPNSITPAEHKALYTKSLGILKWFNGEIVKCEDVFDGHTNIKLINELDSKLNNRHGLDIYYMKPEEKVRKGIHK
jgi:hypothetical protein